MLISQRQVRTARSKQRKYVEPLKPEKSVNKRPVIKYQMRSEILIIKLDFRGNKRSQWYENKEVNWDLIKY